MKNILINTDARFALVGHGYGLFYLYKELTRIGLKKPIIFTHQRKYHKRDLRELSHNRSLYQNIFDLKKETKIIEINNLKSKKFLKSLNKNKITHIFSSLNRWIFDKKIIKKYKNRIFNMHPTMLPEERGSGAFTFRIFNNNFFTCASIHLVDEGVDTGPVLLFTKKRSIKKDSVPEDFLVNSHKDYCILIKKFVMKIKNKGLFKVKKQIIKKSFYLPRFFTDMMGAIDWSWDGRDISSFIKGCSTPYSGAWCKIFYKGKKIKIKIFDCKFIKRSNKIHPFLLGRIFYQNNKIIKVYVKKGVIEIPIKKISYSNKKPLKKYEGKSLFNTYEDLIIAKSFQPNIFKYK